MDANAFLELIYRKIERREFKDLHADWNEENEIIISSDDDTKRPFALRVEEIPE